MSDHLIVIGIFLAGLFLALGIGTWIYARSDAKRKEK